MRKTILKQTLNVVGMTALAILLFACPDEILQKQNGKATVSISVMDIPARTVFPDVTLADAASYTLLGGKDGGTESVLIAGFTGTEASISLEPGVWNFTLNAYNQANEHILQGKVTDKTISLTGTNSIAFSLSPVLGSGAGAMEITITFPATAGITSITVNGDVSPQEFTGINSGEFIYAQNNISTGDYFISFGLYQGNALLTVVSELVLVRSNLTSSKTIALVGDDLNRVLTGTVSISGTAIVLTAITTSLDGTGTISYQWKRNGTINIGTNSSTYIIQTADAGSTITVTVTRTGYSGSVTSEPTPAVSITLLLTSVNDVINYLATQTGTIETPVYLPVRIYLGIMTQADSGWQQLLDAISAADKFVDLDLSLCTMSGTVFYPDYYVVTGKSKIVGITLPNAATSTADGEGYSYTASFRYFTNLKSFSGARLTYLSSYAFYGSTSLTQINLPNVTYISSRAFEGCTGFTQIILPNSLTGINGNVFNGCTSLVLVTCHAVNPPGLGGNVFLNTPSTMQIKVPAGSVNAYKTASGWSNYADRISEID